MKRIILGMKVIVIFVHGSLLLLQFKVHATYHAGLAYVHGKVEIHRKVSLVRIVSPFLFQPS